MLVKEAPDMYFLKWYEVLRIYYVQISDGLRYRNDTQIQL